MKVPLRECESASFATPRRMCSAQDARALATAGFPAEPCKGSKTLCLVQHTQTKQCCRVHCENKGGSFNLWKLNILKYEHYQ